MIRDPYFIRIYTVIIPTYQHKWIDTKPQQNEAQTALFKDPVRTAL